MTSIPAWFQNLEKNRLVVFASLSYYGCDFDGDRKGDLSVWDKKNKTLYYQLSGDGKFYKKRFFEDTELTYDTVFADYDGDGKTDLSFFQPETGEWITLYSTKNGAIQKIYFGSIGDIPVPVNFNGDTAFEEGLWRPNAGAWLVSDIDDKGNKQGKIILEGNYQDAPIAADYDGDRKSDLSVWRPDDGNWHIVKSKDKYDFNTSDHISHGKEWDIIVPNDYDVDGKSDLAFWRPENQTWFIKYSGSKTSYKVQFGKKGDIPLSLDLNSDGTPELITWNMKLKTWSVLDFRNQKTYTYKWNVPDGSVPSSTILQKYE